MPNQSPSARAALSGDYIPCKLDVIEHACLHSLARAAYWNTAGSVLLFRASPLHKSINTASSYPHSVADYRSSGRHRAIAFLAPSLFESYHSSLLYARRHICSNPLELLKSHPSLYRHWTPCVCSSLGHLWRASRSHDARVCVVV